MVSLWREKLTMCQEEILRYLVNRRKMGQHDYLSMTEIEKEILKKTDAIPRSIRRKVNRLYMTGFLDILIPKGNELAYWRRRFRVKDAYLNEEECLIS
jgi:hypothetical protein